MSSWFPFGRDYKPVSLNRFHDETLRRISEYSFNLGSEFFFMATPDTGCVGNLSRERFFKYVPDRMLNLGFIMTFGFSEIFEKVIIASLGLLKESQGLSAGITSCTFWSRGIYEGSTKVIVIASDDPFYESSDYLRGLSKFLEEASFMTETWNASYYAEKFGYDRFFMKWEGDRPFDIRISELLSEFETETTKELTGGSSVEEFPEFLGMTIPMMSSRVIERRE